MTADTTTGIGATVLGYPRFGPDRELKWAVESYWGGKIDQVELEERTATLRASTWREMTDAGLDSIPGNTFSLYDQVLDAAWMLGAIPTRFTELGLSPVDTYFKMARGTGSVPALEMTKWFDTNYHYLVPELGPDTVFTLDPAKPIGEYLEAAGLGIETRPVMIGPVSFLLLSKPHAEATKGFRPIELLDGVVEAYAELLRRLAEKGVAWAQLDEPCLVQDRSPAELEAVTECYQRLGSLTARPSLLVATYFGNPGPALPVLGSTPIEAIALDLVTAAPSSLAEAANLLADKTLVAGIVDGRNIWRTDMESALQKVVSVMGLAGEVAVSSSCSLLHIPYDVEAETGLDAELRSWLSFARQKLSEIVLLQRALTVGRESVAESLAAADQTIEQRRRSPRLRNETMRTRLAAVDEGKQGRGDYQARRAE